MYDKMTENEKQFCLKQQVNLTLKSTKQLTKSYICKLNFILNFLMVYKVKF